MDRKQLTAEILKRLDKIAKKGMDNYIEYLDFFDDIIARQRLALYEEILLINYNFDMSRYRTISESKKDSWHAVLAKTTTKYQDDRQKIYDNKGVYSVGKVFYKEIPRTIAKVIDDTGRGAELKPIISNGNLLSIQVVKGGASYSSSAQLSITGGYTTASGTVLVRSPFTSTMSGPGLVISASLSATGSFHNKDIRLGEISEEYVYLSSIGGAVTSNRYQNIIQNKSVILTVDKTGYTQSLTFSTWNYQYTYEKNVLNLYTSAINYLLATPSYWS